MANPNIILHFETPEYVITPVSDDPPIVEVAIKGEGDAANLVVLQVQGEAIYNFLEAFEMAVNAVELMPSKRRAKIHQSINLDAKS